MLQSEVCFSGRDFGAAELELICDLSKGAVEPGCKGAFTGAPCEESTGWG